MDDPKASPHDAEEEHPDLPEVSPRRRRFLASVAAGLGAAAGAIVMIPWLRVFLTPLGGRSVERWTPVGSVSDFPVGDMTRVTYRDPAPLPWAGFAARNAAWVHRGAGDRFAAFSSYCTHVGCPVRWEQDAELFMCPCHGGAFYRDGGVASGPPPRPLDRYPVRVTDGQVEIQVLGVPAPSE